MLLRNNWKERKRAYPILDKARIFWVKYTHKTARYAIIRKIFFFEDKYLITKKNTICIKLKNKKLNYTPKIEYFLYLCLKTQNWNKSCDQGCEKNGKTFINVTNKRFDKSLNKKSLSSRFLIGAFPLLPSISEGN